MGDLPGRFPSTKPRWRINRVFDAMPFAVHFLRRIQKKRSCCQPILHPVAHSWRARQQALAASNVSEAVERCRPSRFGKQTQLPPGFCASAPIGVPRPNFVNRNSEASLRRPPTSSRASRLGSPASAPQRRQRPAPGHRCREGDLFLRHGILAPFVPLHSSIATALPRTQRRDWARRWGCPHCRAWHGGCAASRMGLPYADCGLRRPVAAPGRRGCAVCAMEQMEHAAAAAVRWISLAAV